MESQSSFVLLGVAYFTYLMPSRCTHVIACNSVPLVLKAVSFYMYTPLFEISLFVDEHLDCFSFLNSVYTAAMDMGAANVFKILL